MINSTKLLRFCLVCCGLATAITGFAQSDSLTTVAGGNENPEPKTEKTVEKVAFSYALDILPFGRRFDFVTSLHSVNPGNYTARLDDYDYGLFLRPEVHLSYKAIDLLVQPRLNMEYDKYNKKYDADLFIQKAVLKYNINTQLYLKGGRYFKQMGTGLFINPSNAFFADPQRINPKLEPKPMDFAELNFSTKSNWNFSLIANLSRGEVTIFKPADSLLDFSRRYALHIEKYGNASQLGFLVSADEDKKFSLGAYAQRNVSEAVVVWTDLAVDNKINRFYPVKGHPTRLINYNMVNGNLNDDLFFNGLVGGSYSLKDGTTFYLEYYYNGKAYANNEQKLLDSMIETASNYTFDITKELARRNLGRTINNGNVYTKKNYLLTQMIRNDLFDKINIAIRYFVGLDDNSHQTSSLIEWNVKDNLEVFSTALFNFGNKKGEFRRLVNNQLMCGLIIRL
jgi:hypothetical protein